MKFVVRLDIIVDPTEYLGADNSGQGAIDLVQEMVNNETDWPEEIEIVSAEPFQEPCL